MEKRDDQGRIQHPTGKEGEPVYYPRTRQGFTPEQEFGYIHVYFGEGVGKTTRAVGLAVRAAGEGLRVGFVQFMKSGTSAEVAILDQIPNISYFCPGKHPFILTKGPESVHVQHAHRALERALHLAREPIQVLVCDEILNTLIFTLLEEEALLNLMETCRGRMDLIMTGRLAPPAIIEAADYVTELVQIKHPYYSGVRARKGIEY